MSFHRRFNAAVRWTISLVGLGMVLYYVVSCPVNAYEWCWNESAGATGYRFYWSHDCCTWDDCLMQEYDSAICIDGRCCTPSTFDPGDPNPLVYYVVTAFNSVGESSTEHGPVDYYWMYYSNTPDDWTCMRRYQVLAEPPYCDGATCTDLGELDAHVASLGRTYAYVSVTAVNAAGESVWDRASARWGCE